MRIKRVEADQFAGLISKEIEFDKGLNILVGDNESGKSTIVDFIFHMLFKDIKIDKRSDNEFVEKYFPRKLNGVNVDCISGTIVFETENGKYKLNKDWIIGNGTAKLVMPDGYITQDMAKINEVLLNELSYRSGVYNEIVFASQKRSQLAVESIMRSLSKRSSDAAYAETRSDFASTVKRAALETGGVALEKVETEIVSEIDKLIGNWDFDKNMPKDGLKRGINSKWKTNVGLILSAYYDVEETRVALKNQEELEKEIEIIKADIKTLKDRRDILSKEKEDFHKHSNNLIQFSLLSDKINNIANELSNQLDCLNRWPDLVDKKAKLMDLKTQKEYATVRNQIDLVEKANNHFIECEKIVSGLIEVDTDDIKTIRNNTSAILMEESKLSGMDITAKIEKLSDIPVDVISESTGNIISSDNGLYSINDAVVFNVPGVAKISLSKKGVNPEGVKANIASLRDEINAIYSKYSVNDVSEIEIKSEQYKEAIRERENAKSLLERELSGDTLENIALKRKSMPENVLPLEEINEKISDLCGQKSLDLYIGALENEIDSYESKYSTQNALSETIESLKKELEEKKEQIERIDKIPDEFKVIRNPEEYENNLKNNLANIESQMEDLANRLSEETRKTDIKSSEEYYDELNEKETIFNNRKKEYEHWKHIFETFTELKNEVGGKDVSDIEQKFKEYLEEISDKGINLLEFDENIFARLSSGPHVLTYDILSEGTKDTISLAFRLAMLEHLYPNGGGLAVFDDPFTDMDPGRVEKSCRLIQKFAENNQVIFITCDNKYESMLSGNIVKII